MRLRVLFTGIIALTLAGWGTGARAQASDSTTTPTAQDNGGVVKSQAQEEKPDPLKRRLSDSQERQRKKNVTQELKGQYKTWLDQDVRWIITDEEGKAFKSLTNDEERDQFIEQFWQRRNPNPDSPENEFRDEHYARIAYANEHFAAGKPIRLIRTLRAEVTNGRWRRVAETRRPSRLRFGTTVICRA
jgi:GWxTD domain-containing protein